jgi:hypothetical protein
MDQVQGFVSSIFQILTFFLSFSTTLLSIRFSYYLIVFEWKSVFNSQNIQLNCGQDLDNNNWKTSISSVNVWNLILLKRKVLLKYGAYSKVIFWSRMDKLVILSYFSNGFNKKNQVHIFIKYRFLLF